MTEISQPKAAFVDVFPDRRAEFHSAERGPNHDKHPHLDDLKALIDPWLKNHSSNTYRWRIFYRQHGTRNQIHEYPLPRKPNNSLERIQAQQVTADTLDDFWSLATKQLGRKNHYFKIWIRLTLVENSPRAGE